MIAFRILNRDGSLTGLWGSEDRVRDWVRRLWVLAALAALALMATAVVAISASAASAASTQSRRTQSRTLSSDPQSPVSDPSLFRIRNAIIPESPAHGIFADEHGAHQRHEGDPRGEHQRGADPHHLRRAVEECL